MSDRGSSRSVHRFVTWSWPVFFAVAGGLAIAGGLFLRYAALSSGPLRALLGASLATLAAWMTSEYVDERWWGHRVAGEPITARRDLWRAVIVVCGAMAVLLLVTAEVQSSPELAFAGLMLLAVGAGPLVAMARGRGADPLAHPEWWIVSGFLIGTIAVALLVAGVTSWPVLAALVVGVCSYGRGLEHHFRAPADAPTSLVARCFPGTTGKIPVVTGLLAAVALAISAVVDQGWLTAAAAWLLVASMMAIGAARRRLHLGVVAEVAALIGGFGLAALASWFVWNTGVAGDSQRFLLFVVVMVAAAGATLIWRLELIFIAVIVGFMFVWGHASFVDGNDDLTDASAAEFSIVTFGDSYISGEGAGRFYPGTDQRGDDRNECRRAPTAYPVLLAERLDASLDFLACSGAKLRHIVDVGPELDDDEARARADDRRASLPCNAPLERLYAQYPCGPPGVYGNDLQLAHLTRNGVDLASVDLVLLSIGGNDARFGEVVAGCLLPGSCAERREVWLDGLDALGLELEAGYTRLREEFGDGSVPIVVMPYPIVMTEASCGSSPFEASEHEFVVEFTAALNGQIDAAARRAGVYFFADGMFSFEGERVCESSEPAVNLIKLQPTDGPISSRMDPGSWTHNSMHPNEDGHELIEARLFAWLGESGVLDGAPNPEADPSATSEILDLRSTRPFVVDPATAADLVADPPLMPSCPVASLGVFATRTEVFDEEQADGSSPAPKVPIAGADPNAPVCVTNSLGQWRVSLPGTPTDDGDVVPVENENRPLVSVEAGKVFVQGGRPTGDCDDAANSSFCDVQWVMFSPPPATLPDGTTAAREWQLEAINYCTVDPDCPDSISKWTEGQIRDASREVLPALGLVFAGGWLFALGVELNRHRARVQSRRGARWLGFDRIGSAP